MAGVGYVMLKGGLRDLKRIDPAPRRTVESIKEDIQRRRSGGHERIRAAMGRPVTGDPEARGRAPEEIQREIELTRERMSQNIDELGEKLSPQNLKRQAKEAITGKAQDM